MLVYDFHQLFHKLFEGYYFLEIIIDFGGYLYNLNDWAYIIVVLSRSMYGFTCFFCLSLISLAFIKVDLLKNKLGFDEAFNYKEEKDLVAALKRLAF